jgi:hypothetical protein
MQPAITYRRAKKPDPGAQFGCTMLCLGGAQASSREMPQSDDILLPEPASLTVFLAQRRLIAAQIGSLPQPSRRAST